MYDASANTAYRFDLRKQRAGREISSEPRGGVPSIAEIQREISRLTDRLDVSSAVPTDVAGRPAYSVRLSPSRDGGLLGSVELAWDAQHGVPLRAAVYARGNGTPVLELKATDVSFGPVAASVFDIQPPPGAKTTSLSQEGRDGHAGSKADTPAVEGVTSVRKGLRFTLSAPGAVGGFPRSGAHLLHVGGRPSASSPTAPGSVAWPWSNGASPSHGRARPPGQRGGPHRRVPPPGAHRLHRRREGTGARHRARHGDQLQPGRRGLHGSRLGAARHRQGGGKWPLTLPRPWRSAG